MAEQRALRRLAAILAADVAGYSRLMNADEVGTRARFNAHLNDVLRPAVAGHGGRIVKTAGDGLLIEFASIVDAVQCAADIQDGMGERNRGVPDDRRIAFRIGLHLGDVIVEGEDIHGDGVNLAARLEALAEPGGLCVSDRVFAEVQRKLDVAFEDFGAHEVKNLPEPVRVYRSRPGALAKASLSGAAAPLALPDKPSIAVLPFDNMSGDAEQEYFSDGITEDIITELSKISGLFVIARHSSFVYKGKQVGLKQVGRDLGVRYALEGSVRKAGKRLRITAQLIDTATDRHEWAERYDRDLEDVFAVQEEVARQVAKALAVALKPAERERLGRFPTDKLDVYDQYLRLRSSPFPPTRTNILTARNAYERLTDIDPSFAGGYAGQAVTCALAIMFGYSERPDEDAETALRLATRAVSLDPEFAASHSALAMAYSVANRHDQAIAAARRAVELQPGNADAHSTLARCLQNARRYEDAIEAGQTALRLDPQFVNGPYLNMLGRIYFCVGRYEDAIACYERNTNRGGPVALPMLTFWAASLAALGRLDEARAKADEMKRHDPNVSIARVQNFLPWAGSEENDRLVGLLRKAGVPE